MSPRIATLVLLAASLAVVAPAWDQTTGEVWGPLSQDQIQALVESAPDEEDRADLDALILFDGTYITYAQGLATVRHQRLIKIFTEWAIEHLGDPRLAYDQSRQELQVHASRTYFVDGSTMDTPDNGYNEVTPSGLDLSADHLNLREMVVTQAGLERGVSVLLDWSVRDTLPQALPFNRAFLLYEEFPALKKELLAEGDLWAESVNPLGGLYSPPVAETAGHALLWQAEDLPARPRDADDRLGDQMPWIALASVRNWEELPGNLGKRIDEAAAETGLLESFLADLEEEQPLLSNREALERIAQMVTERTALVRYQPWILTPLPRVVADCLQRSTATPVERSAVLLAAYRARGLEPDLILPASWKNQSRDVPALETLRDPLLRVVDDQGRMWWIDPIDGRVTVQPALDGDIPYFVLDSSGIRREALPVSESQIHLSAFWDLEAGEAKAEVDIGGPVAGTLGWEEPEKLLRSWAEAWCDSAEVEELRVLSSDPQGISWTVSLKAPLPKPGDRGRILIDLPLPPAGISDLLPGGLVLAQSQVDGILFPPAPAAVNLAWKLRLPEDLRLLSGPTSHMESEGAYFALTRAEGESLVAIDYKLHCDGRAITPEAYPGYRRLLFEASDPRFTRVVFAEPD
jgi:hypothetical protein